MVSGAVVRLQNLSWSANASDIREFFYGYEIPNGGVRIIGGEEGDCFVAFVKRSDAQAALRKDRATLKDQQIRLFSSSEEEMRYVIAIAKGENPPKPASLNFQEEGSRHDNGRHGGSTKSDDKPFHHRNQQNDNFGRARATADNRPEERPLGSQEASGVRYKNPNFNPTHDLRRNSSIDHGRYQRDQDVSQHSSLGSRKRDRFPESKTISNFSARADSHGDFSDDSKYGATAHANQSSEAMKSYGNPFQNGPNNSAALTNFATRSSSEWMPNDFLSSNSGQALQNEGISRNGNFINHELQHRHDKPEFDAHQRRPAMKNNQSAQSFNHPHRDAQQMQPSSPYSSTGSPFGARNFSQGDDHDRSQGNLENSRLGNFPNSTQALIGQRPENESISSHTFTHMTKPLRESFHPRDAQPLQMFNERDTEPKNRFSERDEPAFGRRGFPSAGGLEREQELFPSMQSPMPSFENKQKLPQFPDLDQRTDIDQRYSPKKLRLHPEGGDHFTKMSPAVDRDSDLRSASSSSLKGRPAAASKSVPLLPTPGEPSTVRPLLDVKLFPKTEPKFSNRGLTGPPSVPNVELPPPKLPSTMNERSLLSGMPLPPTTSNMVSPFGGDLPSIQHHEMHGFLGPQIEPFRHPDSSRKNFDSQAIAHPQNRSHILRHQDVVGHHNHSSAIASPMDESLSPGMLPPPIRQPPQQEPFHNDTTALQPVPERVGPAIKEVTDPCAYFTNLPGNIQYKQLRGLFATHNIIALNIKMTWPKPYAKASEGTSEAVVLFDTIDGTVLALNELKGAKIMGFVINIEPCSQLMYDNFSKSSDRNPRHMDEPAKPRGSFRKSPERSRVHDGDGMSRDFGKRARSPPVREPLSKRGRSPFRRLGRRSRSPVRKQFARQSRSPHRARSPRNVDRDRHRQSARNSDRDVSKIDGRSGRPRRLGDRAEFRMGDRSDPKSESKPAPGPADNKEQQEKPAKANDDSLPPPLKSNNPASTSSWPTVLTGLPPKATKTDVEQFLTDIQYDPDSLYLEFNVHGECTGTAYVELTTEHSLRMLMNSPKELLKQTIQVNSIIREHMIAAVALHKQNLATDKTKPGEFVLQFMGLPPDASPRTVSEFLYPTKIKENEVTIIKLPDGRCSGTGFVKVHSLADREEALKHDRGYIGKRYVTIRVVSEQVMNDLISKHHGKSQVPEVKQPFPSNSIRTVKMVNLRYDIMPEQVEAFFRDYNPERGSVQFNMNNGMPTGKGTIRLKTAVDASKVVEELNKKELAGRPILLSLSK